MIVLPDYIQRPVMTPDHPQWKEFCRRLGNFECKGNLRNAKKLLRAYDADIELSIEFFKQHCGFCDCEILLNIA
jgi:hypothetical protein